VQIYRYREPKAWVAPESLVTGFNKDDEFQNSQNAAINSELVANPTAAP